MKINQHLMKFNDNQSTSVKIWWNLMKSMNLSWNLMEVNEHLMKFNENYKKSMKFSEDQSTIDEI